MRPARLPSLLGTSLLVACATPGPSKAPTAQTQEQVETELRQADVAFDAACRAHDSEAFARLVCPDAAFGGRSFSLGREEVVARWAPLVAGQGVSLTWAPDQARSAASGALGYTTGAFELRAEGAPAEEGRYLTVWRREGGRFCAAMDTVLQVAPELANAPREAPVRSERSREGDLVAETGWLAERAGTWLEVRRCDAAGQCRVEALAVVKAPPAAEH